MAGQIQNIDMTSTQPIHITPYNQPYGYPMQQTPQYFYQPQPVIGMEYQNPYQMNTYQNNGAMWGQQPIGGPIYR